jgi:hypothetical protein
LGINQAIIRLKQLTRLLFFYVVTSVTPSIASYHSTRVPLLFHKKKKTLDGYLITRFRELSFSGTHGAENGCKQQTGKK